MGMRILAPAAVVLLALAVRLHDLGEKSVWLDEGYTVERAWWSVPRLFESIEEGDEKNPPLYYLFMHVWVRIFGDSDVAIRIPSVLFGAAAVLVLHLLVSRFLDARVGLLAALLTALSAFHVEYSQEARAYSLLVLLALLSVAAFLAAARRGGPARWAGFVISAVLLAGTHVYGYFALAAIGVGAGVVLLAGRAPPALAAAWWKAALATGIALGPGFLVQLSAVRSVADGFWIPDPGGRELGWLFMVFAGGHSYWASIGFLAAGGGLAAWATARSRKPERAIAFSLWLWLLLPVALGFLVSKISTPILWPKYAIAASPALYVLAAWGALALPGRPVLRAAARIAAAAGLVALTAVSLAAWHRSVGWEPWKLAVAFVEERAGAGEQVFFHTGDVLDRCYDRYRTRPDLDLVELPPGDRAVSEAEFADFVRRLADGRATWIVLSHERDGWERLVAAVEARGTRTDHAKWRGIEVLRFAPLGPEGPR